MALAWFICPYKRRNPGETPPTRYCAMDDFTGPIWADNGWPQGNVPGSPTFWSETEILGDAAIVKVRAEAGTLSTINAAPGFLRIPNHVDLGDTLGDLTAGQKQVLLNKAVALGYSLAEIQAALPTNWSTVTLRQVLAFLAQRRLKPRYDPDTDEIVLDGAVQPVRPLDDVVADVA